MITYLILTISLMVIIVILNLIKIKPKEKPSQLGELLNDPRFKDVKDKVDAVSKLDEGGTDEDTIPEGFGKFGYEVTNPIPLSAVTGDINYFPRLQTSDGIPVHAKFLNSTNAPNIRKPIHAYEISLNDERITTLYFSINHKRTSKKAPIGFKLEPYPINYKNKTAEFLAGFVANMVVFSIAIMFTEVTFLKALLFSIINATWMLFLFFPYQPKITKFVEKKMKRIRKDK